MPDLIALFFTAASFALALAYIAGCESLAPKQEAPRP
jgi:hypothetical protein